jgi:salicylate hydroxylase
MWQVHRADYQQVLYKAAAKRGVTLRLGCPVVSINENKPSVTIKGREVLEADIIIGADSEDSLTLWTRLLTKSTLRITSIVRNSLVTDSADTVRDSGMDVTRVNIPETLMRSDPLTAPFMEKIGLWYGPSTTIAGCPLRRGSVTCLVYQIKAIKTIERDEWLVFFDFCHTWDENSADGVSRPQKIEQLKSHFKYHAPAIQKGLSYVEKAHVWRMMETMPESWVSKSGKVALTGDAAHAVLS